MTTTSRRPRGLIDVIRREDATTATVDTTPEGIALAAAERRYNVAVETYQAAQWDEQGIPSLSLTAGIHDGGSWDRTAMRERTRQAYAIMQRAQAELREAKDAARVASRARAEAARAAAAPAVPTVSPLELQRAAQAAADDARYRAWRKRQDSE